MTDRIQQLVSIIEIQEAGLRDLWERFEHETRIYLNSNHTDEQCLKSADAGAAYREAKIALSALRSELTSLRIAAGHSRFSRTHPERNLPACTHTR